MLLLIKNNDKELILEKMNDKSRSSDLPTFPKIKSLDLF
jgi:hypothetical protein